MTGETKSTSTGINENIAGLLCYLLGWITGLVFILIEKENRFIRFHAMQSIITFGVLMVVGIVLGMIPMLGTMLSLLISIGQLALWIVLMIKAYQGEYFKLPVVGDIAEKNIG